jgi:tetratricopeptide (TPR) repeat protein
MFPLKKIQARYETVAVIGKGGMGVVYKAIDTVIGREVALKTIRDVPSRMALELFRKECSILAGMSHPNIIEVFDIGEFEDEDGIKPYFVMPLLPGVTLEQLSRTSSQRLTVERTVEIMLQTCRGLHAAHERGLVHRDLKPSNIFVMPDDSVKIIDFGVAHMAETHAGMTIAGGTLLYMSPEQVEMKPASPMSDIFSLGVVFYEALTRRRPFEFPTEQEMMQAILHHNPPPASELNPAVSQVYSRIIYKAMAKQSRNRFASAKEFAETLQKAQRNEPIEFFDPAKVQPRIQRASRAFEQQNYQFATEILNELEAEGHFDPAVALLRQQVDHAVRQKTLAQLLESARTCCAEEEYPLALQKVQEALQLDPNNAAALGLRTTIENTRNEQKVDEWLRVARQHLDNHAFGHARDALNNLLQLEPNQPRALQLMSKVDRRERDYLKTRQQKEELYQAATESWKNGEMSAALTKLERLLELERRAPDPIAPERGITYQNFYHQVRSEHDLIQNAYQEARRCMADGNYTMAVNLCKEYLAKYPQHALFQALKFDIEERQRQELSSRIAEIDRRVEAEPDIERRINILKQALEKFPGEPHFEKALRLAREKRDLVNAIVAKARNYEDSGQFNEALAQWEILGNIHKQYPGMEFEIERVKRRLDQQLRSEAKARGVDQVDRLLESREYVRAIDVIRNAVVEFPNDPEMAALETLARQSQGRASEAEQLLARGYELRAQGQVDEAIETVRRAHQMDALNTAIRAALQEMLMERARAALETDWRAADALCQQVLELDPANSLARSVSSLAQDRKREEIVNQCTTEARRFQAAGDAAQALTQVEQVLTLYPGEPRLTQLRASLARMVPETKPPTLQPPTRLAEPAVPSPERARDLQELESLKARSGSPQQVSQAQADAEAIAARNAADAEVQMLATQVKHHLATMLFQTAPPPPSAAPPPAAAPPRASAPEPVSSPPPPAVPRQKPASRRVPWVLVGSVAAIVVCALALTAWLWPVAVEIRTDPAGAVVWIGDLSRGSSNLQLKLRPGTYRVEVRKDGYLPASGVLSAKRFSPALLNLVLQPVTTSGALPSAALRISTDLASGQVTLDDRPPEPLQDGQFAVDALPPGKHTLKLNSARQEAVLQFETAPGEAPGLTAPVTAKDFIPVLVGSTQKRVRIFCSGCSSLNVMVDGRPAGRIGADTLELQNVPPGQHELTIGEGKDQRKVNFGIGPAPVLSVFLNSDRNVGSLLVLTGDEDVRVVINGKEYRRRSKGGQLRISNLDVKQYAIKVFKDGYQEEPEQQVVVEKGKESRLEFKLRPVPNVAALSINGAPPGAKITLDQKPVGAVQPDGAFSWSNIAPGEHVIELRALQFKPKSLRRNFKAGEVIHLTGDDVALESTVGVVRLNLSPASATVVYSRAREGQAQEMRMNPLQLEEGAYTFRATAPGYQDRSETVNVVAGRTHILEWKLAPAKVVSTAAPTAMTMEEWAKSADWKRENQWYVHRGGGFVLYPASPTTGSFTFTVMRSSRFLGNNRMQWVVNHRKEGQTPGLGDTGNYLLFQVDKKHFYRAEVAKGKKGKEERQELPESASGELRYTMKVDISPGVIVHSVLEGENWKQVDRWPATGGRDFSTGRFGFLIPGSDELMLSNFTFTPK